jgi:hypothetical protein
MSPSVKKMPSLRISEPSKEGKYSVSKWIKHQVLLDVPEMEELCRFIAPAHFYNVSEVLSLAGLEVGTDQFLNSYKIYIDGLKSGQISADPLIKKHFSSAISIDPSALYACVIGPDKYMAKPLRPLIQMQQHRFFPSKAAGEFHSMVMSQESVHWGIQFSYPQIFHNGSAYTKVTDPQLFPNTPLFTRMVQWFRSHTVPTTFLWGGKKIATSFRLGKECFGWINDHPQLKEQGIEVHVY